MSQTRQKIVDADLALRSGDARASKMVERLVSEVHESDPNYHDLAILQAKLVRATQGHTEANKFIRAYSAKAGDSLAENQRRDVLSTIAENERILGRHEDAWRLHFQLMRDGGSASDARLWTWAVLGLARIAFVESQPLLALRFFVDAAGVSMDRGDVKNLAWSLRGIADSLGALEEPDHSLAEAFLDYASRLFVGTGHLAGELWTLQSWGDYWERRGEIRTSIEFYRESMVRFRHIDERGHAFAAAKWGVSLALNYGPDREASEAIEGARAYLRRTQVASGTELLASCLSRLPEPEGQ